MTVALPMDRRRLLGTLGAGIAAAFIPWTGASAHGQNLRGYIRTNWSRDPYSFGSYSYVAKGARQRDRADLEKPVDGRLFFAGEAVFPDHNATVHSAYESGQRAAEFVLQGNARRVAIIGAGMSGLSAAHKLAAGGLDVTVFEARDRIGGRIWTQSSLGIPLDLGASWIHGTEGNPLTTLADSVGLARIATDDSYINRGRNGRVIDDDDVPDWLEDVVSIQHSYGADRNQINRLADLFEREYGGEQVKFPNGFAEIFDALRGPYSICLSNPVNRVSIGGDGVTIASRRESPQRFDATIVTLPLGVLKRGSVAFDPPLPAAKVEAIERLGMGTLDKVYLLFDKPFWDADTTWIATPENGLPPGQFNEWLNLHKFTGEPVMMAFNGGTPALDLAGLSDEEVIERARRTLEIAYPN